MDRDEYLAKLIPLLSQQKQLLKEIGNSGASPTEEQIESLNINMELKCELLKSRGCITEKISFIQFMRFPEVPKNGIQLNCPVCTTAWLTVAEYEAQLKLCVPWKCPVCNSNCDLA